MPRKQSKSQLLKQKQNQQHKSKMQKQYELSMSRGLGLTKSPVKSKPPKAPAPYRRETQDYPSLDSGVGDCSKKEVPRYTGDKLVGIGMMHKSNLVPIFNKDEAEDISRMRRG